MERGTVVRWLVEEGDEFSQGQEILEVETDKATVAVTAHQGGRLARILAPAGQEEAVGALIAVAVPPGEELPSDWTPPGPAIVGPTSDSPLPLSAPPAPAPGGTPPVTASWKARVMAQEAGVELPSITGSGPEGRIVAEDVTRHLGKTELREVRETAEVSPAAANLAEALGLDPAAIPGSGPQGRVMRSDVIKAAAERIRTAPTPLPEPADGAPQAVRTIPLTGIRGRVSEHMASSAATTARVTLFRQADAEALTRLRARFGARGQEISYNDLLIRICAHALRIHPEANARMGVQQIEYLDRIHIGVAVDTERGLLVPVVHDADRLSVPELAKETARLIEAARSGQIGPDDLTGGTFTITNLGMLGVEAFTPVINVPECCILGVGRIAPQAVVSDDGTSLISRQMISLSLAFDHRVIDGAPAARFLGRIATLVEDPTLLL